MKKFEHITDPYPYICLQDLHSTVSALAPDIEKAETFAAESELFELQREFAPENSTLYPIDAHALGEQLELRADYEVNRADRKVGVVHMDKTIGSETDNPNYFRLNVSRSGDGNLVARIGTTKTPEEQLQDLGMWAQNGGYEELLFVDDVLAFGSTVPTLFKSVHTHVPDSKLRLLVGIASWGGIWRGIQRVQEETGVEPEYLVRVEASEAIPNNSTGMAIPTSRDLTLLGGKVNMHNSGQRVSSPYFLPFSAPLKSITRPEMAHEASHDLLAFNDRLFQRIGSHLGNEVKIGCLAIAGFGIPYPSPTFQDNKLRLPDSELTVREYISQAQSALAAS